MIEQPAIEKYLSDRFGRAVLLEFGPLGEGVHGKGFSLKFETPAGLHDYVIKELSNHDLGHDYPSDRAGVFLLAESSYEGLPDHVKAIDVVSLMPDGTLKSVGGGKEYYLVMERASGTDYFTDLTGFREKRELGRKDKEKVLSMTGYLSRIHSIKRESRTLYWRKLRDTIGSGECLMGVFDTYPDGTLGYGRMAEIEKRCVEWRARLKPLFGRLCQIHGDFHPGNILFHDDNTFTLLDRSRGPFGDPADDITALTINYIFFSVKYLGEVAGPYAEALELFFSDYMERTGDEMLPGVCAPFLAFRGAVVANPVFYPELESGRRELIFRFISNVMEEDRFDFRNPNRYL